MIAGDEEEDGGAGAYCTDENVLSAFRIDASKA